MTSGFTPYREKVMGTLGMGYKGSRLGDIASVLWAARRQERPILICGNGGSAATAIHFAADLRSLGFPAHDLLSPAKITQIANDEGYLHIFTSQIQLFKEPIVVAFSCTSTSPNIRRISMCGNVFMILFTGRVESKRPKAWGNLKIIVESDDCEIVEDVHLMMCHALKKMLRTRMENG